MIDDIKSFPPLPESIAKIQELCMSQEVNINALVKVIESDPMLSANILKAVNSPMYGMSKVISSIHQAMMLFGVSMIRGFAAANAIKKTLPLDLSPYGIGIERLSEISTMQQALVKLWYGEVDKQMLPLLLSTSFLMELGKLVSASKIIKLGIKEPFFLKLQESHSVNDVEKSFCEMGSYEVSALMFEHWNFEPALIDTLKAIASPTPKGYGAVLLAISEAINVKEVLSEEALKRASDVIAQYALDQAAFDRAVAALRENMK